MKRSNFDSTFDYDSDTVDQAEELAFREALRMLGQTAGKLRGKERPSRNFHFRNAASTRIH
jgi:hypothetical protein